MKTHAEIREFIRGWNRRFNGGSHIDEPEVRDGIEFWRVGRNASHDFYAGVRDGKCFRYSAGEDWPEWWVNAEHDEDDFDGLGNLYPTCVMDIKEVPDFRGYYGHF